MITRTIALLALPFLIASCSTYSSNVRVGNDLTYVSLSDQRDASLSVNIYDQTPDHAIVLGTVDAGRCHRSFVETSPNEDILILDLKIAAYVLGADGIANIDKEQTSALTKNCWYMRNGKATAFRFHSDD